MKSTPSRARHCRTFFAAYLLVVGPIFSQVGVVSLPISVRKAPKVDPSFEAQDAEAILARASLYFSNEVLRWASLQTPPPDPVTTQFQFRLERFGDLAKIAESEVNPYYTGEARRAIVENESKGLFGKNAIENRLIQARAEDGLQIIVAKKLPEGCPGGIMPPESEDQGLGCAVNRGFAGVLRPIKSKPKPPKPDASNEDKSKYREAYDKWVDDEGLLWAHEIGHLMGLRDLLPMWLNNLPAAPPGFGWMMMSGFGRVKTKLLPEECSAAVRYSPSFLANAPQLALLYQYLDAVHASSIGSSPRPSGAMACVP